MKTQPVASQFIILDILKIYSDKWGRYLYLRDKICATHPFMNFRPEFGYRIYHKILIQFIISTVLIKLRINLIHIGMPIRNIVFTKSSHKYLQQPSLPFDSSRWRRNILVIPAPQQTHINSLTKRFLSQKIKKRL